MNLNATGDIVQFAPTAEVFELTAQDASKLSTIPVWEEFNALIPKKKENYEFNVETLRKAEVWLSQTVYRLSVRGWWMYGHMGTSKTSFFEQLAARVNLPLYSVTGSETMDISSLLYSVEIRGGDTVTILGPLGNAYVFGGLFLFDEINYCLPHHIAELNEVLNGTTLLLPDSNGEMTAHPKSPHFFMAATSNGNGSGSDNDTVDYSVGTNVMNPAFRNRFNMTEADYLNSSAEIRILTKIGTSLMESMKPLAKEDVENRVLRRDFLKERATKMVKVANLTRGEVKKGNFDRPLTLRDLEEWMRVSIYWIDSDNPISEAAKWSFMESLSELQLTVIGRFCSDVFGESEW